MRNQNPLVLDPYQQHLQQTQQLSSGGGGGGANGGGPSKSHLSTPSHSRILTPSSSFDSKSNSQINNSSSNTNTGITPGFAMYQMSAEAARLFQTLQQSPLPIATHDVII